MTDGVPAIRPTEPRGRDQNDREDCAEAPGADGPQAPSGRLPVASPRPAQERAGPGPSARAAASFAAQLLGQGGLKRGLKGGKPVLDGARAAYLEAEWSGPADRRTRLGRITKTEV